jgi:branched-chain amino acid transport system permease protein
MSKKAALKKAVLYCVGSLVLLVLPFLVRNEYVSRVINTILIYSILSLGLNLVTGFAGQLSLGHAAFYGIGAYATAILGLRLGIPFPLTLVAGGVIACLFGILLGIPTFRVEGDYLCIVTIGFAEIIRLVFLNWMSLTRGPMGLPGVPPAQLFTFIFSTNRSYYYLFLVLAGLTLFVIYRIVNSQIGRAFMAIREDPVAASAMGINIAYYKILAFAIGAFFAGIAGSCFAHYLMFVGPNSFNVDESLIMLQTVILGGLGSIPGCLLGTVIMIVIPELFRAIYLYRMLWSGILLIVLMLWRPQGILGKVTLGQVVRHNKLFAGVAMRLRKIIE